MDKLRAIRLFVRLADLGSFTRVAEQTNASKSMALYNLKNIRTMAAPAGNISSRAHKQHLRTLIDNSLKEIK